VNLASPGWTVQETQAVWQPKREAPELIGELLVATHPDGSRLVQFSKQSLPLRHRAGRDQRLEPCPRRCGRGHVGTHRPTYRVPWFHPDGTAPHERPALRPVGTRTGAPLAPGGSPIRAPGNRSKAPPHEPAPRFRMNRRRWLWLLAALLLVVGLARLRFDADIFNLLPGDLPAVRGLQLQQRNFSNARELLVTLKADDAENCEQRCSHHRHPTGHADQFGALGPLAAALARTARDAAENLAWLWLQRPPAEFAALTERLAATNLPRC
jgi:hypothetical protein